MTNEHQPKGRHVIEEIIDQAEEVANATETSSQDRSNNPRLVTENSSSVASLDLSKVPILDHNKDPNPSKEKDSETETSAADQSAQHHMAQPPRKMGIWEQRAIDPNIDILDPPRQIIPGFIAEEQVGVLTGAWGVGKSFLAVDLLFTAAYGFPINSKAPERTGIALYFCGEGQRNTLGRIKAAQRKHGLPDHQRVIPYDDVPDLGSIDDVEALIDEVHRVEEMTGEKVVLIIIDTLSRAVKGGPDTENTYLKPAVEGLLRIRDETKAAVVAVHHPPVTQSEGGIYHKRPRGGGFIEGDTDFSIFVERQGSSDSDDPVVKMSLRKQRDMPDDAELFFKLKQVELGPHKRTGEPVTSCVVDYVDKPASPKSGTKKAKESPAGLSVIRAKIKEHGVPAKISGHSVMTISKEIAQNVLKENAVENGQQADTGKKQFDRLLERGDLIEAEGQIVLRSSVKGVMEDLFDNIGDKPRQTDAAL
ncbi:AAA family ATPase [Hoeflea alexandrii]|uniref:AAA family ATPase n=1 Tax=Hoeflea alexandrii TaxID=288436 RepID=UPI0035CFB2C5